jgi:hypothetical protein
MKATKWLVAVAVVGLAAGCATTQDWSQTVRQDRGYYGPQDAFMVSVAASEGGAGVMLAVDAQEAVQPGFWSRVGTWAAENPGKTTLSALAGGAALYWAYTEMESGSSSKGGRTNVVTQEAGGDAITVIGDNNVVTTTRPVFPPVPGEPTAPVEE